MDAIRRRLPLIRDGADNRNAFTPMSTFTQPKERFVATRTTIRTAALAACLCLAIALPLLAAQRLAVKTGLWENAITMQITGVSIPAEQLAQMSAEERAQAEALMKELGMGAPRTLTEMSCLTEKDLDGNAFLRSMEEAGEACDYQQVTATAKKQEWTFQCRTGEGSLDGRMQIDVLADSRVQGAMQAKLAEGSVDMKFEANWKSADCGDVKPEE